MGRKHFREWKHIHLCIACLALLLIYSCASVKGIDQSGPRNGFLLSNELMRKGNYMAAAEENERIISIFPKGAAHDTALFNLGLIYAHPRNPGLDYRKAADYFSKVIERTSDRRMRLLAESWISMINRIKKSADDVRTYSLRAEKMDAEKALINKNIKLLSINNFTEALEINRKTLNSPSENSMKDNALFNIGLIYAHYDNPQKDYKMSLQFFRELVAKHKDSPLIEEAKIWISVLNIIEKAKQVDIDIEKKKKEMSK